MRCFFMPAAHQCYFLGCKYGLTRWEKQALAIDDITES